MLAPEQSNTVIKDNAIVVVESPKYVEVLYQNTDEDSEMNGG